MPGLFGILRFEAGAFPGCIETMRSELERHSPCRRKLLVASCESLELLVSTNLVIPKGKGIAQDERFLVGVDGSIWNWREIAPPAATAPEAILRAWSEERPGLIKRLRGHFVIGVFDKGQQLLSLASDHIASKPLYWVKTEDALLFASELKALLPVLGQSELDLTALAAAAHLCYTISDRTFVKPVRLLMPGRMLNCDHSGRIRLESYYEIDNSPGAADGRAWSDRLYVPFAEASARTCRYTREAGSAFYATLTGGYDSRAVVTLGRKSGNDAWTCLTIGDPGQVEVRYARRCAKAMGQEQEHVLVDAGRMDFLAEGLDQTVSVGEGMCFFSDVVRMLHMLKDVDADRCRILHTAVYGGTIVGQSAGHSTEYKPPPSPDSHDDLDRLAGILSYMAHPTATRELLRLVGDVKGSVKLLRAAMREVLDKPGLPSWGHAEERGKIFTQLLHGTSGFLRGIEVSTDYATVYSDPDLMDVALHMPLAEKVNQRAYSRMLRQHVFTPDLLRVPTTHNFAPMRSSALLTWKEAVLKRKLYISLLGRLHPALSHRRYGDYYRYVVLTNDRLRDFVYEELCAFEQCGVFAIEQARLRAFLERWRRDPRPFLIMSRPLLFLLHMKRWFDFWGEYVSDPGT